MRTTYKLQRIDSDEDLLNQALQDEVTEKEIELMFEEPENIVGPIVLEKAASMAYEVSYILISYK